MAFTGGSLADGQVGTTWSTLYGTSGFKAIIRSADFHVEGITTQMLELAITRSTGTRRKIFNSVLGQSESLRFIEGGDVVVLGTSDTFLAQTTTAGVVNFAITGATE